MSYTFFFAFMILDSKFSTTINFKLVAIMNEEGTWTLISAIETTFELDNVIREDRSKLVT